MADLRLDLKRAIERLRIEEIQACERVQGKAAELERELRQVAVALEKPPAFDVTRADLLHVFDIDTTTANGIGFPLPADQEIGVCYGAARLGSSRLARALPVGRYRAILQLTKIEPEAGE